MEWLVEALLWSVVSEAWLMAVGRSMMAMSSGGSWQKGAIKCSQQLFCGGDPQAGLMAGDCWIDLLITVFVQSVLEEYVSELLQSVILNGKWPGLSLKAFSVVPCRCCASWKERSCCKEVASVYPTLLLRVVLQIATHKLSSSPGNRCVMR